MTATGRPATDDAKPVVLVAMCSGQRCAALRRLHEGHLHEGHLHETDRDEDGNCRHSQSEDLLRRAIRDRPEAVLVSVPCVGPCSHGSVAVVGPGLAGDGHLTWLGRPTVLGLTEDPQRAHALADWIASTAPDVSSLPAALRAGA